MANNYAILKKLWTYLSEFKNQFIILILFSIITNILALLGPFLIGKAINIINTPEHKNLLLFSGALIAIYILETFISLIQNRKINSITQKSIYKMRKESFIKFHNFPINYFDNNSSGNILSILINDIDNISSSFSLIGTQIITSILTIFVALGIMFFISPFLTTVQLFLFVFAAFYIKKINFLSREKLRVQQSFLGKLSGYTEEILMGQKEIKSFSYENNAIQRFKKLNNIYKLNAIKGQFLLGLNYPSINFIGNISYVIIILLGSYSIIKGNITIGGLSSFIIYSKLFNRPIANLSDVFGIIQSVLVSSERFFSFVNQKEEVITGDKKIDPETINGEIVFENVCFSYSNLDHIKNKNIKNTKNTIENLSFHVKPGEMIAIVGPTGSGKTTLVNLIMRFYEINSGTIKLDGVDIKEYSKSEYRRLFGMVLQDTWFFSGTIKDNIAYGNDNVTEEMIIEGAKKACAHDFIIKLPKGYDTPISEDNILLSHAQKQLLAVARAIVSNPKFLIFDEATSGVDTRTEKKLQDAMKNIISGRTSFIIAHRLSTIRNANLILVVNDGKIVEIGKHEELINKKGLYFTMYNKQ